MTSFISFLISHFVTWRKGLAPYYWLFACGPIGLVVIHCQPSLKLATDPEGHERLENRTNLIVAFHSGISIFQGFMLVFFLFAGIET